MKTDQSSRSPVYNPVFVKAGLANPENGIDQTDKTAEFIPYIYKRKKTAQTEPSQYGKEVALRTPFWQESALLLIDE